MTRDRGTRTHSPRRKDIQGLRALAVVAVVLSHAQVPGVAGGFIGVDIFFVISGFLITSLLLREIDRTGRISLRGFYERRARRILPAATVVILAVLTYAILALPTSRMSGIAWDAVWSALFLANVHFAVLGTDYFAATDVSPLQHFWSLAVEEQFYLVWPLLLLTLVVIVSRRRRRVPLVRIVLVAVVVIIVGSLISSAIQTSISPVSAYFSTIDRAYELAGGALLAIVTSAGTLLPRWYNGVVRSIVGWLGLGGLAVMIVKWNSSTPIPGLNAGLIVLATAAVIASGIGGVRGPGRLLSIRPARFVGDISYSLYLWHWPLLTLSFLPAMNPRVRVAVLVALSVVVAVLSYKLIEQPFLRRAPGRPRRYGGLLLWPIAVTLVIGFSVGGVAYTDNVAAQTQAAAAQWYRDHPAVSPSPQSSAASTGTPSPAPSPLEVIHAKIVQALSDADAGAPIPSSIDWDAHKSDIFQDVYPCVAWWEESTLQLCPVGDTTSARTVVLVGDSHAGQWISALDELGKSEHFKLVPMIKPACNVYDFNQSLSPPQTAACNAFKKWSRETIAGLHPEAIVVGARGFDGMQVFGSERDSVWRTGAESGIRALMNITTNVFVLSDIPPRSSKADECLTGRGASLEGCIATDDGPEIDSNVLTKEAALAAGAKWIDTTPLVCDDGRCPVVVDGHVVYFDDNHLTVSWGRVLSGALGELLHLDSSQGPSKQ